MRKLFILLLLLPLLTACLGLPAMGPGLDQVSKGFSESMRWRDYSTAAGYVHLDVREAFLEQFTGDKDLHIVDSRIVSIIVQQSEGLATAVYEMEYYLLPSSQIKKWEWEQHWRLQREKLTKTDGWLIINAPPPLPWKQ